MFKFICLMLGLSIIGLYIRSLYYIINALSDKADVYIKEKFLLCLTHFLFLLSLRVLKSDIFYNLTNRQSIKKLTTSIIYISINKNILFYIYLSKKSK